MSAAMRGGPQPAVAHRTFAQVAGIIVIPALVVASFALLSDVQAQPAEPVIMWQLGACEQKPGDRPACVALGSPVPEGVCNAMRRRLVLEGFPGRPVCARVLVDATEGE